MPFFADPERSIAVQLRCEPNFAANAGAPLPPPRAVVRFPACDPWVVADPARDDQGQPHPQQRHAGGLLLLLLGLPSQLVLVPSPGLLELELPMRNAHAR